MIPDPITFGLPRENLDFARRNASFLEVLPRLTHRINEIIATRTFERDARGATECEEDWQSRVIAQRLVFFLGRLAVDDFMEILLLCGNGYGMAGLKLLRSMFEGVITGIYLTRHPLEANAFVGYHVIHQRRFLRTAAAAGIDLSQIVPPSEQERIEREYSASRDSYRQARCPECDAVLADVSWTQANPLTMAREIGLQQLAVQCYSFTTLHIHTTPTRLLSRVEETEQVIRFRDGPQRPEADAAMVGAHCCIAHVLDSHNRYFNLNIAGLEAELSDGIV